MTLEELVTLKALKRKQLTTESSDFSELMIEQILMKSDGDEYRNVCAHVSIPLADELDELCKSLDISKRRFIEGALIDAVKRSNAIISQVKPFELES